MGSAENTLHSNASYIAHFFYVEISLCFVKYCTSQVGKSKSNMITIDCSNATMIKGSYASRRGARCEWGRQWDGGDRKSGRRPQHAQSGRIPCYPRCISVYFGVFRGLVTPVVSGLFVSPVISWAAAFPLVSHDCAIFSHMIVHSKQSLMNGSCQWTLSAIMAGFVMYQQLVSADV